MRWARLRNLGVRAETTCSLEGALRDLMAEPMAPMAIELRASPKEPRCSLAARRREEEVMMRRKKKTLQKGRW